MNLFRVSWWGVALALAGSGTVAQPVPQQRAVSRIYVEPFPAKPGSDTLRAALIAQLRKLRSLSLVPDAVAADAILSGSGEVWIKGYRSLNPRSGRLPSNGAAIYGGFLSVELSDVKGDTLWSYLATESASEDLSASLARRTAKHFEEALAPKTGP